MTLLVWRGQVHRVITLGSVGYWVAYPEGFPELKWTAEGPDQAVAQMGYTLDRKERPCTTPRY